MDLSRLPPVVLAVAGGALLLLAVVQSIRLFFARWGPRRRLRLARERGAEGEVRAEALLSRLGYSIVARQAGLSYGVSVDGEPMAVSLRADFVVERDSDRFVAEVKTGALAPRLSTPATRRQLLEYRVAFDVAGVLLVDVDAGRVHRVEFPLPGGRGSPGSRLVWGVLGAVLGACLAALALSLSR
ncbi:MAG: hypothetical protein R3F14_41715 [Polyangiaceae bacterium]